MPTVKMIILDTEAQNAIWRQVQEEFNCDHEHTRLAVKTNSNGSRSYGEQCQTCGSSVQRVKKSDLSPQQQRQAISWNDNLMRDWSRRRSERYTQMLDLRRSASEMIRRLEYNRYLATPEWQAKRCKIMERSGGICEGCRSKKATDVHHLTYDRFGAEMLFDLVAVCRECHNKIHTK